MYTRLSPVSASSRSHSGITSLPLEPPLAVVRLAGSPGVEYPNLNREPRGRGRERRKLHTREPVPANTRRPSASRASAAASDQDHDGRGFRRYRSKQALPGNLSLSPTARTVVLQALPASPPLAESDYPGPAVAVTLDAIQGVTMPPHPHEQQRWWQPGSTTARTEHVAFTRKEYSTVR